MARVLITRSMLLTTICLLPEQLVKGEQFELLTQGLCTMRCIQYGLLAGGCTAQCLVLIFEHRISNVPCCTLLLPCCLLQRVAMPRCSSHQLPRLPSTLLHPRMPHMLPTCHCNCYRHTLLLLLMMFCIMLFEYNYQLNSTFNSTGCLPLISNQYLGQGATSDLQVTGANNILSSMKNNSVSDQSINLIL